MGAVNRPGFPTHARVGAERPIDEIVAQAPTGQVPMFWVQSAYEDSLLGSAVYIKAGHVHDCMTDRRIAKSQITGLTFDSYINS